ncbi:hypothetical protein OPQ81_001898 [Rhizoctonia solani]|nr:hypothetical protein OPQ81_001898 [Rhizoctonia solani]
MLRWGRWAAIHVVGTRLAVFPGSKNVSRVGWVQRPVSLVPALALSTGRAKTKMTNEDTDITIARPNSVSSEDPLGTLRKLLTDNRPDVGALESAYMVCRTHHLCYLTKSEFSSLVSAAGDNPKFVLMLCTDQIALGRRIPDPDRYQYMLAHLVSCLRALESGECDTAPIEHLAQAQNHYTKLAKNQSGPAVHHTYLEQLLRIYQHTSDSAILSTVRDTISNVLKSLLSKPGFRLESSLSQVVWRIIASVQFDVSHTRALLHILRSRVSLSGLSWDSGSRILDPIEFLRRTILDFPCPDARVNQEAHSILHDTRAWQWLRVLAGTYEPTLVTGAKTRLDILVLLRQHEHGSELSPASLERCWDDWMAILGVEATSHGPPAETVDRAILLTFLRLAVRFHSTRVVSGSERLLTVYNSVVYEEDRIHMAQPGSLSVQLGAAYACTGTLNLFQLAARLSAAGLRADSSRLPAGYLTHLVELLLGFSPRVAWEIANQGLGDLPVRLVASVAHDCAKAGYLPGAVSLLRDTRLKFGERYRIALVCLRQLDRQGGVLTRVDALHVCEALGPDLSRTPLELRSIAVRTALNAGLVQLAGLMGSQWRLKPLLQRLLATRLVKANLPKLAFQVVDKHQTRWFYMVLNNSRYRKKFPGRTRRSRNLSYGRINATRIGNQLLIRSGAGLGGRAQLRATLATLARLLRSRRASRNLSRSKRARFRPDGVTLNILMRALVRCTFCVSSSDLRALFDLLSRAGRCGRYATGNHFGTEAGYILGGYASSGTALAKLVPPAEGPWAFVRYVRPLLKTFALGMRLRGDKEAVMVVMGILRAEDAYWRRASWRRTGGPDP